MAAVGDYSAAVTNVLTNEYARRKTIEVFGHRNIFYNLIDSNIRRIGTPQGSGEWIKLDRFLTTEQHAIAGRREYGDIKQPGRSARAYSTLYPHQLVGSIGWTEEELKFCEREVDFENIVLQKWTNHVAAHKRVLEALWSMDGTGRVARVSGYTRINAQSGVITVDNTQANFGIDRATLMWPGLMVDIYSVPRPYTGTWQLKAKGVFLSQLNRAASATTATAVITARTDTSGNPVDDSVIAAAPADGDYVFIADTVELDAGGAFVGFRCQMGIHGIVDDGQDAGHEFEESGNLYNHCWYGATIQGLNRTAAANAHFRSRVSRASDRVSGASDGTPVQTDMDDLDAELDYLFQNADGPDPENIVALCNAKTGRWWRATARSEQNGFELVENGKFIPGMGQIDGFRSATAKKVIPVYIIPTCADGTIIFLDLGAVARWELEPMGPITYGGKTEFESPGTRNRTCEGWYRSWGNLGFSRSDTSLRVEDIRLS